MDLSAGTTINPEIQSNPSGDQSSYYIDKYYEKSSLGGKNYYFLGDIPLGVDDLQTNTLEYVLPDHLQSKSIATDNQGSMKKTTDYYPYGNPSASQGVDPIDNDHQFIGKVFDPENSLQYFGARYYDNITGRFMAIDPLTLELTGDKFKDKEKLWTLLSDPQRLNGYSYANNNPIINYDPDGRLSKKALLLNPVGSLSQVALWKNGVDYLRNVRSRASADFLNHSLQLNPSALTIQENSLYSYIIDDIKKSTEYRRLVSQYISVAKESKKDTFEITAKNSLSFETGDLFTSLHAVTPKIEGRLVDGEWQVHTELIDIYNYEYKDYSNPFIGVVNNSAFVSSYEGVISPYNIKIEFNEKIKNR